MKGKFIFTYNTADYLLRFRTSLLTRIRELDYEVIALTPYEEGCVEKFDSVGVRWKEWRVEQHSLNPLTDWRSLRAMTRTLEEESPESVFNFTVKAVIYGSLAARGIAGVRVFSMIPGLGEVFVSSGPKAWILQRILLLMYRISLRNNMRVFFQNPDDMAFFTGKRIVSDDQSVLINGSGVDLDYYAPREKSLSGICVLMACRLLPKKGVQEYIDAARIVKERHPDISFLLAGPMDVSSGAVTKEYLQQVTGEGVINYLGELDDVRPYIASSVCVALPSYYGEGQPRILLESLAMGIPIVTTDMPGCRSVVEHGKNGLLVAPKSASGLADALLQLVDNPGMAREMGIKARQTAIDRYDVNRVTDKIIAELGL